MEKQVYLYAIAKSLHERGEDYIDSFRPFIIKILPDVGKYIDLLFVQKKLNEEFNLLIPVYTLETIMKRLKRKHFVEQGKEKNEYMLTIAGQEYLDNLEADTETNRRLTELLEDLRIFLNAQLKASFSTDQIHDLLYGVIKKIYFF